MQFGLKMRKTTRAAAGVSSLVSAFLYGGYRPIRGLGLY